MRHRANAALEFSKSYFGWRAYKILQVSRERFGQFRVQVHMPIQDFGVKDAATGVYQREMPAIRNGDSQAQMDERIDRHYHINSREEFV